MRVSRWVGEVHVQYTSPDGAFGVMMLEFRNMPIVAGNIHEALEKGVKRVKEIGKLEGHTNMVCVEAKLASQEV